MSNKTTKSKTQNYNTITVTSCPELFPDSTWFSTTVDGTVADSDFDYTYSIGTIDQTPADEIEKAELILAGICPACRRDDGKHDARCPHFTYDIDGITITTASGPNTITIGDRVLTEDKLEKLDKILDAIDDIDVFLDKLKN